MRVNQAHCVPFFCSR